MIKLTVNPLTRPVAYSFEKTTVVIGSGASPAIDLTLENEQLEPIHIKISEQGSRFVAINHANDPFVTINGIPFGKKFIQDGDVLEIGSTQIQFKGEQSSSAKSKDRGIADTAVVLPNILDKMLSLKGKESAQTAGHVHHNPAFEPPPFHHAERVEEFDLENEMRQLDAWLQETSHLAPIAEEEQLHEEAPPLNQEAPASKELPIEPDEMAKGEALIRAEAPIDEARVEPRAHKQTIKDLYFKDQEDDYSQSNEQKRGPVEATSSMDWHTIWIIVVGVISTIILAALLLYANASGKSEDDELKVAESISDVSMALAYAKLNNIVPQNQNWSDPEFLKNNLAAVLSSEYPLLAQLDSHGQFSDSPYLLRIYTSSDLSNFLVIAQPAPSLLHWLIPKSTILIYSDDMELRKTTDLKSLNRLLVNPSLDGSVANEVSNIVKKADIITLSALSKRQQKLGFSPPKALALMRPGAENYIYNAPRYYNLGEAIMLKAVALAGNQQNDHEIILLKQEIESLRRYPDLVLYSSQGMQAAVQAQKALALFDPEADFFIAYFQYTSQGAVHSSHLIPIDGAPELALKDDRVVPHDRVNGHSATQQSPVIKEQYATDLLSRDIAHPLFFQLSALSASRQQMLRPISQEIVILLESETQSAQKDFHQKYLRLTKKYLEAVDEQQRRVTLGISRLYQDYAAMPLVEFMHYAQAAGLELLAKESLKEEAERSHLKNISAEMVQQQLDAIGKSENFEQLEASVSRAGALFTIENVTDPDQLMSLQNQVRKAAVNKIDLFLLSHDFKLPPSQLTAVNRARLEQILKSGWVRDREEIDYYMTEFDHAVPSITPQTAEPISEQSVVPAGPVEKPHAPPTLKDYNRFWMHGRQGNRKVS